MTVKPYRPAWFAYAYFCYQGALVLYNALTRNWRMAVFHLVLPVVIYWLLRTLDQGRKWKAKAEALGREIESSRQAQHDLIRFFKGRVTPVDNDPLWLKYQQAVENPGDGIPRPPAGNPFQG